MIGGEGTVKQKRKPTVKDKVEAVVDKVVGAVERKPGKKVRLVFLRFVVVLRGYGDVLLPCL